MVGPPVICDASVVVPWFHSAGEQQVEECRAIAAAPRTKVVPRVSDLTQLEVGNALVRKHGASPEHMAVVFARTTVIAGLPIRLSTVHLSEAVALASEHGLTVYDASYWALARASGAVLATLDSELIRAGAGVTPASFCDALALEVG